MRKFLLLSVLIFVSLSLGAQNLLHYYQSNLLKVFDQNNNELKNAFGGGLKFPVFSQIDLNFDQKPDIVIFDRIDGRLLTFINEGVKDTARFVYRPEFEILLPDTINSFLNFIDYDRDGKLDIFSYFNGSMDVYRNISFGNKLLFELYSTGLESFFEGDTTFKSPFYLSPVDIPSIVDIDGDKDLDIITFDITGGWILEIKNRSMEKFGRLDTFDLDCSDNYYGYILETDNSNKILLNAVNPWGHKTLIPPLSLRHAGSTLLNLDLDEDKDMDLLIGDAGFSKITQLINGKNEHNAKFDSMISQYVGYPASQPVNIHNLAGMFLVDLDNDTIKDLVCSPMATQVVIDTTDCLNQVWYYKNVGKNNKPNFQYVKNNLFQEDMIDLGGATSPAFFDFDGDGDEDLFVATLGNFRQTFYNNDRIVLFENIGSATNAIFKKRYDDYLNLSSRNYKNMVINFGDVDGDGDKDLIFGHQDGKLSLYLNNPQNDSAVYTFSTDNYKNIDVGDYSSPCLADITGDSLADLLIGTKAGTISYYKNTGSKLNPDFTLMTDTFGGIFFSGGNTYPVPFVADMDTNGHQDLIVGAQTYYKYVGINMGRIYFYKDIDKNPDSVYTAIDTLIFNNLANKPIKSSIGLNLKPAIANLDGDKIPDMVLGNNRGGLLLYASGTVFTNITADGSTTLCPGDSLELDAGAGFDGYNWNTGETSRKITVKQAGSYECTVRKGSTYYKAYITISQHPGTITAAFTSKNDNRTVTYTLLNDNIDSVLWDFGDGATSTQENPVHTYSKAGNYKVCLTITDFCGAKDTLCKYVAIVGIKEDPDCRSLLIYPNPANDMIYIRFIDTLKSCCYKVELYNALGQLMTEKYIVSQELVKIPIINYRSGIYFLRMTDLSGKVIKQDKIIKIKNN
jgi:hypothetical protein